MKALQEVPGIDSVPVAVVAVGVPSEQPEARGFYDPERATYID